MSFGLQVTVFPMTSADDWFGWRMNDGGES